MSYFAGWPVPSFTSVKASVNPFAVTLATARSLTSAGLVTAAVIVTAALPLCPSLVAVIVAAPAVTPVTKPLPFTTATAGALLAHVTTRPATALPLASLGVAVSCTGRPRPRCALRWRPGSGPPPPPRLSPPRCCPPRPPPPRYSPTSPPARSGHCHWHP